MDEKITKVLLIDLENCPNQINQLMNHLDEYSHIVICYAQSGAKIPVDWIMPLTTTINNNRLKLVKMPEVGKNAADFGIAFWAGVLMAQLPENTHFDIVSNDTDLDYAVSLLTEQKRSAERRGMKKEILVSTPIIVKPIPIPVVETKKIADSKGLQYLNKCCIFLKAHNKNKPTSEKTLLNSINAHFKVDKIDASIVFKLLITNEVVSINNNKLSYNQQKIIQFAK